jgi:hypothetical protein
MRRWSLNEREGAYMVVRFLIDPDTDLPHIEGHGVSPQEVLEILRGPSSHGPGRDGTRVAEGQTLHGRYLRVIYKENEVDSSIFVITAYDLVGKAKAAYRRRKRSRP